MSNADAEVWGNVYELWRKLAWRHIDDSDVTGTLARALITALESFDRYRATHP